MKITGENAVNALKWFNGFFIKLAKDGRLRASRDEIEEYKNVAKPVLDAIEVMEVMRSE